MQKLLRTFVHYENLQLHTRCWNIFRQLKVLRGENGVRVPIPEPTRSLGSVVSFPSGVGGGASAENDLVLSRRDRTPLVVMSVMLFDKPENVQ